MADLIDRITNAKVALRSLAASAGEAATEADRDGEEDQAEELHKLAGWASSGAGKMRKLLDPEGANLLCEFLGQMPLNFPGESYPGERADNERVARSGGISSVTVSTDEMSVTLTPEEWERATDPDFIREVAAGDTIGAGSR